jgi:hypothetical protein
VLTKDQLKGIKPSRGTVEVSVPGWPDSVLLRYPTYGEWQRIVAANIAAGNDPPPETIVQTVGTCLANPDGSRMLTDAEALALLQQDASAVVFLYKECCRTVLKVDGQIEDAQKN